MFNMKDKVISTIKKHNMLLSGEKIIVGVSGGADSVSLLHILSEISIDLDISLVAVHINHGIRGDEAYRDEKHVENLCRRLNIECICRHVDVPHIAKQYKMSEEMAGRKIRYEIFNEILHEKNAQKIAVAHNKNDSVETVIMKLIRGASLNGLKGISPVNGNVIRPLIECERENIELYLSENNIHYITDSTNNEDIYTRNMIRHNVIPVFEKINPNIINTIFLNSQNIAIDDDFINQQVKLHSEKSITVCNDNVYLDMKYVNNMHDCIKKRLIMEAYNAVTGTKQNIEQKHINILLNSSKTGKTYTIGNGVVVKRDYDKLVFTKKTDDADDYIFHITDFKPVFCYEMCINFSICDNNDISDKSYIYINYDKLKGKNIYIRNRRAGDKFLPSGMKEEKKISRYFIDNKISKQKRLQIPLLCTDEEVVAVLGLRVSDKYIVTNNTKEVLKITISGGNHE